jgi:hypothetical protein
MTGRHRGEPMRPDPCPWPGCLAALDCARHAATEED